jgi:anaerobic nitric oxide reductase transcription regulator
LRNGELQRPGSDRLRRVDVRVLQATNRDLSQEIARGRFRADLYHRLSVYPLQVPALRECGRDVLTLAGSFLDERQHRLGKPAPDAGGIGSAACAKLAWQRTRAGASHQSWSAEGMVGADPSQAPVRD